MEYAIIGSVLSLLLGMKFTAYNNEKHQEEYNELVRRLENVETYNVKSEKEMLKNVMTTVAPIATAVQKLNREVGLR